MSVYKTLSEKRKIQMKEACQRWRAKQPAGFRKKYYKQYDDRRLTSLQYRLYRSARQRANEQNITFDITENDIPIHDNCPICNIKMEVSNQRGGTAYSPTLDKIIPEKGYTKGNVDTICKLCNSIKGSGNAEIHRKIADYIDRYN